MIVGGYYHLRFLMTFVILKLFGVPFAFYSDTPQVHRKRSPLKRRIRALLLDWVFKNAKFILSTGQVGLDNFKSMGCPEAKLKNLPWAIDLEVPLQIDQETNNYASWIKRNYAPPETIIFACAGQLDPRKGYDVALKSFSQAVHQCPERPAVLLMAGDGPQRPELEELAKSLGLAERIHFLGWLQPDRMKGLFKAADILVHPAQWDPYPVAVLEAMAWGLPVLASDQTMAAVDRVRQGESGFIHPVDDVAVLAEHISYFLADPGRVRQMGAQARKTAEQWPVSRCTRTIINLL